MGLIIGAVNRVVIISEVLRMTDTAQGFSYREIEEIVEITASASPWYGCTSCTDSVDICAIIVRG